MHLYDVVADPDALLASLNGSLEVLSSEIFVMEDFGLWGEAWPGAMNIGWRYLESFDLDTLLTIEVGMLDADRNEIVKYTADAEQIAWQRANGYINPETLQTSAPFYVEYNGTPIAEGRDLDWTVIFGSAFADWNPRWGYIKVTTSTELEQYEEKEYKGVRPDITPPVMEEVLPAEGALVLGPDDTFVLTVDAMDDFLYSLELDHSMEAVLPEFTVYADADNPYGSAEAAAEFAAAGVTVTYDAVEQIWIIDFGPAITAQFIENEGITFYMVLRDVSGHTWGSMDPTTAENTYVYTITLDDVAPTISEMVARGAEGFEDVTAVDLTFTVEQGYTVETIEITMSENVVVADGTVVSLAGVPYGTLTGVGNLLTVTPYPGNEVASELGTFVFSIPEGSVTDLVGNELTTLEATLIVVNVAPVAEDDAYTTPEDVELVVAAPGVLENDVDRSALTAELVDAPVNGTLSLNADGSFTYLPDENWFGTDSFTYRAFDGTDYSEMAVVTITVTSVNDAPVADDDSYTTDEDTVLTVAAPGVLVNDSDVDGDELSVTLKTNVTNGVLVLNGDGSFTYTPNENWSGTDSFVYTLVSYPSVTAEGWTDEATVTITVNAVNDAPVAVDDAYSTDFETPLTIAAPGLLANDSDIENSALIAVLVTGPANGLVIMDENGSFTYTPEAGFSGTDSFTYMANDGELDSNVATVTITVGEELVIPNTPPVAQNDTYTTGFGVTLTVPVPGVLGNDSDADGDSLTAIKVSDPTNGTLTLNANGSFTYIPNATFSGFDSFTYKANDGLLDSNVATVSILVEAFVNTAPVAQDQTVTTPEDTAKAITLVATDADGDSLTYSIVGQPLHGTVSLVGNVATYTPDLDYTGSDSFTFKANDGLIDSNVATVSITVTPVNDAPVAVDDEYTVAEGAVLTIAAPGVLANDHDVDNTTLTAELVSNVSNGTLTLNANGSFTYTPNALFNGTDSFTYRAKDSALTSDIATVTITVTPVNNEVIANDDWYETPFNTTLVKGAAEGVLANDVLLDPDEVVSIVVLEGPQNGTLSINDDGSFTYTPDAGFFGRDTFRYMVLSVRVNGEWSDDANVYIDVKPFGSIYLPLIFR